MAVTNYRDIYTIVKRDDISQNIANGTPVFFCVDNEVYLESGDDRYGVITNYVEDIEAVNESVRVFRRDGIIPIEVCDYAFAEASSLETMDISMGEKIVSVRDFDVVYVGTYDLEEYDMDICFSNCLTERTYQLTDKGRALLEDICTGLENCVCPEEREENSTMDNLFGNLGFGKLRDPRFKLSMNGIAVGQGNGKYVVYNQDKNEFVDVTATLFDIKDALFLLPAVEVNAGDTVLHEGKPYFIVDTTNEIKAVSYEDCTQTVLIPKSTMFGIKYFTKVFSMFGDNFASTGDLFSNPMMLMALMDGSNSDLTQLMLLNSLNNGDLGSNPMALAMMLKGDKSNDSLSTIALMSMFNNGTNPFAPKKKSNE